MRYFTLFTKQLFSTNSPACKPLQDETLSLSPMIGVWITSGNHYIGVDLTRPTNNQAGLNVRFVAHGSHDAPLFSGSKSNGSAEMIDRELAYDAR
jgi:hypothetical protein